MTDETAMRIYFPGGQRVYADYEGFTIATDQSAGDGGEGSAPAPFDYFMASIGTCAGIYACRFMQQRGIPTEDAEIRLYGRKDPETGLVATIDIQLRLPPEFPGKYRRAVIKAMDLCTVKKHLHRPPAFEISTIAADEPRR